ncbi:uncharacterized protein LOC136751169 isoform X13 [Amia ocellicauda]|uniref:uncharacterized protein LOC136751169 isoform X13 n=1 Tax=Amia ocellicauda TaxID=2972642 RepID=UPI00346493CC
MTKKPHLHRLLNRRMETHYLKMLLQDLTNMRKKSWFSPWDLRCTRKITHMTKKPHLHHLLNRRMETHYLKKPHLHHVPNRRVETQYLKPKIKTVRSRKGGPILMEVKQRIHKVTLKVNYH